MPAKLRTLSSYLIVGFDILECADLDETIAIAAEHPMASREYISPRIDPTI